MQMRPSEFFQSATMALVLLSFVAANLGNESSMRLWLEGWESIAALISLGVGMKIAQRSMDRRAELKYGKPPADKGFGPEGGEP